MNFYNKNKITTTTNIECLIIPVVKAKYLKSMTHDPENVAMNAL